MSEVKRKLRLPLGWAIGELLALPDPTPEEIGIARSGANLIRSLLFLEGGSDLSIADILDTPEEVFDAALDILNGGRTDEAGRLAVERIEEGAFAHLSGYLLERVPAEPDPSVAAEFV